MLNDNEVNKISEHIYTSDQDFFFYSSLYGEPFLYKNFIFFFDGECLSISGYPLNKSLSHENQITELNELITRCLVEYRDSLKIINHIGVLRYSLFTHLQDQFEEIYSLPPDKKNVDIFIDLSDSRLLKTSNAKEAIRKYRKNGIQVTRTKYNTLNHRHLSLLRKLILREDICIGTTIILLNVITIIHSDKVRFFEAHFENEFVGFAVVHDFYPKSPFLIAICPGDSVPNVSDALYLSIINYYLDNGAKRVGVGYSINDGLLYYKTKWGGAHRNLPYHQSIWKRKDLYLDSIDIINWIGRLIDCKLSAC